MGKKYLETKANTLESAILGVWKEAVKVTETNKNDKSDDGEGLDAVQPKAVKKKFKDRKDTDIDNDGDTDSSDKFLHKRRKAISKAIAKDEAKKESFEVGTDSYRDHTVGVTPGENAEWVDAARFKVSSMKRALAKVWGLDEKKTDETYMTAHKKKKDEAVKKGGKTETGGEVAEVEIDPKLKDK